MYQSFVKFIISFTFIIFSYSLSNYLYAQTGTTPSDQKEAIQPSEDEGKISESIPVEALLSRWEENLQSVLSTMGIEGPMEEKLLGTGVIVVFLLLLIGLIKLVTYFVKPKLNKFAKKRSIHLSNINFYFTLINYTLYFLFTVLSVMAILELWELSINAIISDDALLSLVSNLLSIVLILLLAKLLIDISCSLVEKAFQKWSHASQSRIDTLLPIAKNTIMVIFIVIFSLIMLSEFGINVMPLLAGAGVLGFAIGFGAQTIIKDLLTGFIIILEDLIQVGDVVTLSGCTGSIEKITIRKVQIRSLDGTVYTVPFGEIDIVKNLTKEFSYALFEIGVAYRENIDDVNQLLQDIFDDLKSDDSFNGDILDDLEIFGLDKFGDSAVVIKARIKTKPAAQWSIMREFNHRMKVVFDNNNVEIPFPHQTIYFGEDKNGNAPPLLHKNIGESKPAANEEDS